VRVRGGGEWFGLLISSGGEEKKRADAARERLRGARIGKNGTLPTPEISQKDATPNNSFDPDSFTETEKRRQSHILLEQLGKGARIERAGKGSSSSGKLEDGILLPWSGEGGRIVGSSLEGHSGRRPSK